MKKTIHEPLWYSAFGWHQEQAAKAPEPAKRAPSVASGSAPRSNYSAMTDFEARAANSSAEAQGASSRVKSAKDPEKQHQRAGQKHAAAAEAHQKAAEVARSAPDHEFTPHMSRQQTIDYHEKTAEFHRSKALEHAHQQIFGEPQHKSNTGMLPITRQGQLTNKKLEDASPKEWRAHADRQSESADEEGRRARSFLYRGVASHNETLTALGRPALDEGGFNKVVKESFDRAAEKHAAAAEAHRIASSKSKPGSPEQSHHLAAASRHEKEAESLGWDESKHPRGPDGKFS